MTDNGGTKGMEATPVQPAPYPQAQYPQGQAPAPYPQAQYPQGQPAPAPYPQAGQMQGQPPPPAAQAQFNQSGVTYVVPPRFTEVPVQMKCTNCHTDITTTTESKVGLGVWAACGGICLTGLGLPCLLLGCCFIPFCIESLKDIDHICPNCKTLLGTKKRFS